MTAKERFLAALERKTPDRLPVTTHHVMEYFLRTAMNGISSDEFFRTFGLDPIRWVNIFKPDAARGEFFDPTDHPGEMEPRRISSETWRIEQEVLPDPQYNTIRYTIVTPKKPLTTVLQSNEHTTWVSERLIKDKSDIDLLALYATKPLCDIQAVNRYAEEFQFGFFGSRKRVELGSSPQCQLIIDIEECVNLAVGFCDLSEAAGNDGGAAGLSRSHLLRRFCNCRGEKLHGLPVPPEEVHAHDEAND
ncbi:MAG: hypothetical protein MUF22_05940 [Chitinispirillaceae bacterium]|nr:hypothetical protein [Chitinispirillaceae bacterium]